MVHKVIVDYLVIKIMEAIKVVKSYCYYLSGNFHEVMGYY